MQEDSEYKDKDYWSMEPDEWINTINNWEVNDDKENSTTQILKNNTITINKAAALKEESARNGSLDMMTHRKKKYVIEGWKTFSNDVKAKI